MGEIFMKKRKKALFLKSLERFRNGSVLVAVLVILIITVVILGKLWFLLGLRLKGYP
jgi:heme/copper-type cytochrome/quinol oxidase subunit 4